MTLGDKRPPQDRPGGLEDLVRSLARTAVADEARGWSERAEAAEETSRRLAERVALLEGRRGEGFSSHAEAAKGGGEGAVGPSSEDGGGESTSSFAEEGRGKGAGDDGGEAALPTRVRHLDEGKDPSEDNRYALPESTFSLLVTEPPLSIAFAYAAFSIALSIVCLGLTLASSVAKGTTDNPLGVPAGVTNIVRAAQFFGVLVGVLMEDEIPQGLQHIANGVGGKLMLDGHRRVQMRVILPSVLRLIVGYLFLSSLFINIVQNSDVIEIFYDVLALEFVENIDDTSFNIAKRGFFGRHMLVATLKRHTLELPGRRTSLFFNRSLVNGRDRRSPIAGLIASNSRANVFARTIYFLNAAILLAGLTFITVSQENGKYRCKSVTVSFNEEIWEHANVLKNGSIEERLVIYSHFSGTYKEDGTHHGYPRYVEQSKVDGTSFLKTVGAELKYCDSINAWVLAHPHIFTSPDGEGENECGWLWKSPETQDFDLISTSGSGWEAWVGEVASSQVLMTCNECYDERSMCSYHGSCEDGVCVCDEFHFGDSCEFEVPCPSLASEKASSTDPSDRSQWKQDNPIRLVKERMVYNRPLYIQKGLSGEPYDMRMYKLLEPDPTSKPSGIPSESPSQSPTSRPSSRPSASSSPTSSSQPTISYDSLLYTRPTVASSKSGKSEKGDESYSSDSKSAKSPYSSNEYELAPDFADWDDFFESKPLHDLEDILDDYSVILSFSGSRFYGTIVDPDASFDDLFPPDYHAFWSQSFDENRTFIISDTTDDSSPVGIDFFEMRRRINTLRNANVQFAYGPYGTLIPLINYDGAGFFHCMEETSEPSSSPSSSRLPSTTPSLSNPPSNGCIPIDIDILHDSYPSETSWEIFRVQEATGDQLVRSSERSFAIPQLSLQSHSDCLPGGVYRFTIRDSEGDGIYDPGYYNVSSFGQLIAFGWDFGSYDTTTFSLPVTPQPSASPSASSAPTIECFSMSVNIFLDGHPFDISWSVYEITNGTQEGQMVEGVRGYPFYTANSLQSTRMCLKRGQYSFNIADSYGDGLRPPGYFNIMDADGEAILRGGRFRTSKTYTFSIPGIPIPSASPSASALPSKSSPPTAESCINTPGYVDVYGGGCELYEEEANVPFWCIAYGDAGETPNENCCICRLLADTETTPSSQPSPEECSCDRSQVKWLAGLDFAECFKPVCGRDCSSYGASCTEYETEAECCEAVAGGEEFCGADACPVEEAFRF